MSSGRVSGFAESKFITGAVVCADIGCGARTAAATSARARMVNVVFMVRSSTARARAASRQLQDVFLDAPRFDLAEDQLVRIAAIKHVDHLKSRWVLPRLAELAQDSAIQFRLVDLAGYVPRTRWIAVRVRIGK